MRFMIIVKANPQSEAGVPPSQELMDEMAKYNKELADAGALIDLNGLLSTKAGAKVKFSADGQTKVVEGPFTDPNIVAGYWVIKADSLQEAVDWAKRVPFTGLPQNGSEAELEIRQIAEMEDLGASEESKQEAARLEEQLAQNKNWSVR